MTTKLCIAYLRTRAAVAIGLVTFAGMAQAAADRIDARTDAVADRRGILVEQFHPAFD